MRAGTAVPEPGTGALQDVGDFGLALRQIVRRARGASGRRLTCRELARQTGYSHSAISNWLAGRALASADHLGDLLAAIGATPSEQRALATARDEIEERRRTAPSSAPAVTASAPLSPVGQPPPSALEVRYSLPLDSPTFTGRDEELRNITAVVTDAAANGGVVAIHAINGMPGVGKTALAVHVAHVLRGRFPDRQLFIDLHAHTPGQEPTPPETALAGLLTAAGVDARNLPEDLESLAGLWRDRMAGQRALLVLDNAADSDQVSPLLPGSAGCLVLATSRRHLGDLPGAAIPVLLEALPPGKAQDMFLRLAPRAATGPEGAVAELARLAGHLPLAITLLARVYARHPSWTLADLTRETKASLLTLSAEKNNIAAAFDVSYRYLAPGLQQFFRRLGLHPGNTIDAYAAAALSGLPLPEAAGHLDALHREGVLTEISYRRYRLHDLIRRYARDRAAADPATERGQALDRLLHFYQHTAGLTEDLLARQTRPAPALTAPGAPPAAIPSLADPAQALSWARVERGNLLACLDHVTGHGEHARVIALTAGIAALLRRDGPWTDAIARHTTAARTAGQVGDRLSEASALNDLGITWRLTGDYRNAAQIGETALDIYRDLGDRLGEANALSNLGVVRHLTGSYPSAAQALETSLDIYRDLGDRLGEANALSNLRIVRRRMGDYPSAAQAGETALNIYRDLGDRHGQAIALSDLGIVRRLTGDYQSAAHALETALDIYCDLGDRQGQAMALCELGIVQTQTADYRSAAQALETALDIYRSLGDQGAQAESLNDVGTLYRVRGDLDRARASHQQALDLARDINSPFDEAQALAGLGRCVQDAGYTADAQANLRQALEIFQRLGAAEASGISGELEALAVAELNA
jgi:tetratricopeptide (TPR) repeat protein/transcriptional regulator with XRE-family HTH domain